MKTVGRSGGQELANAYAARDLAASLSKDKGGRVTVSVILDANGGLRMIAQYEHGIEVHSFLHSPERAAPTRQVSHVGTG